jgi:hypothetical protein
MLQVHFNRLGSKDGWISGTFLESLSSFSHAGYNILLYSAVAKE